MGKANTDGTLLLIISTGCPNWRSINYILMQQHNLSFFLNTWMMKWDNCSTEHIYITFTTKLQVWRRIRKDKIPIRKFTNCTITINRFKNGLQVSLNSSLAEILSDTVEEKWNTFKSIMYKVFKEKLGNVVRKHEDWCDGKVMALEELIHNENQATNNMIRKNTKSAKPIYRSCFQHLQQKCRELKKIGGWQSCWTPDTCKL